MRLLLFSDLHNDAAAARRLVERARQVDLVVGAGDYAGMRQGLDLTLKILRAIECPTVLVPGNHESYDELSAACEGWEAAHVLHGTGATVAGVAFWGLGGGVPKTPFGPWSYDLTEEQAEVLLEAMPEGCVLVSHSPPKGLLDQDSRGRSLGSAAVLAAIEAKQPRLVVCGHIHGSAGQEERHGTSVVINAGPAGVEWTLRETAETA